VVDMGSDANDVPIIKIKTGYMV